LVSGQIALIRPANAGASTNEPTITTKIMKFPALLPLALGLAVSSLVGADAPALHGEKPPLPKTVKNVGVEEFDKLRSEKNTVVLDVRTEKEFKAGHIPGAVNLDYNSPDFAKKAAELDKSKTYLVHCAGGVRSAKACTILEKSAFPKVVNLAPGFKAWEQAGKPVEKK